MTKLIVLVYSSPKTARRVNERGEYHLRRGTRRGGKHPGDPHLIADYLALYRYLDLPGSQLPQVEPEVYAIEGPATRVVRKAGKQWLLRLRPTDLTIQQLEFLIDPRPGLDDEPRGAPVVGVIRQPQEPQA